MLRYLTLRLLNAIPTLWVLATFAFFIIRLSPGGPFDSEKTLPDSVRQNLNKLYHLDEPLFRQYTHFLGNLVQGDFGPSFQYQDYSVNELIWSGFPISLQLGLTAMILALGVGGLFGVLAAAHHNSHHDRLIMLIAMLGISIPNFVVAPVLILLLSI